MHHCLPNTVTTYPCWCFTIYSVALGLSCQSLGSLEKDLVLHHPVDKQALHINSRTPDLQAVLKQTNKQSGLPLWPPPQVTGPTPEASWILVTHNLTVQLQFWCPAPTPASWKGQFPQHDSILQRKGFPTPG